jgi:hypothetical protein
LRIEAGNCFVVDMAREGNMVVEIGQVCMDIGMGNMDVGMGKVVVRGIVTIADAYLGEK